MGGFTRADWNKANRPRPDQATGTWDILARVRKDLELLRSRATRGMLSREHSAALDRLLFEAWHRPGPEQSVPTPGDAVPVTFVPVAGTGAAPEREEG